ncbi:amidohydrolase [Sphingobium nicotianae]|uniref:Amidohydrolase family protein n=1 Tax=Sphingobium nicotianae TaxID=2782607 RepID=A0A9X1IPR1_9SPHN|nr:amidohydrolase family protein [Sphingobium nicotianae]MBT2186061.1 amidohydrolase family protein [Sphingobium nicotianae]
MQRRDFIRSGFQLAAVTALAAPSDILKAEADLTKDMSFDPSLWMGDLAIVNANVYTLDPRKPKAQAVLVRNGRILLVGSTSEIRSQARGIKVLDAGGSALVPGFVDTHCHLDTTANGLAGLTYDEWFDNPPQSVPAMIAKLREIGAKTPPGKWIVANGVIASAVPEKRLPTMAELDSLGIPNPIIIRDNGHNCTFNSMGAKLKGLLTSEDQANMRWKTNGWPVRGGFVTRDDQGRPITAYDYCGVTEDLFTPAEQADAVSKMINKHFVSGGITTLCQLPAMGGRNHYYGLQMLQQQAQLPMRIRAYFTCPYQNSVEQILSLGLARGFGNDMFRMGGIKIFVDQARFGGGEITLDEDTENPSAFNASAGQRMMHQFDEDELANLLVQIQSRGFPVLMHVLSEAGTELCMNAVKQLRERRAGLLQLPHRVEHWRPTLENAKKMKDLNMFFSIIATAPNYPADWAQSPGTTYRDYVAAGCRPVLASDFAGGYHQLNHPIYSIAKACNEQSGGGDAAAGQAIDFETALKTWTLWAAESTMQAGDRGTITPGKLGDFSLLSGNPGSMKQDALMTLKNDVTILGGKVVYER